MSWKQAANSAVFRVTRHRLTRETEEQRRAALERAARNATAQAEARLTEQHQREIRLLKERAARRREKQSRLRAAREAREAAERAERTAAAETARQRRESRQHARFLARFDEELYETVERVRPQTMTSTEKIAALIEATRYVVHHRVPGAVVECGVWRGGSMQAVALTLMALHDVERELHLFDTFEGMPPPTDEDSRVSDAGSVSAEELLASSDKDSRMWAIAGLDVVRQAMAATGYPEDRLHYHAGLVEDTTPGRAPETIALLRLDTDWYASTKHELEHLYGRLSPGGVLILDDYGDWEGARKATDEWLAETGEPIFLAPMGSGAIGVKPLGRTP